MPKADGEIIGNLRPVIPNVNKQITNIDEIIQELDEKTKINKIKLDEINTILLDIDLKDKNINSFINLQSKVYTFSASNIGSIDDLNKRNAEIDRNKEKLDLDKNKLIEENEKINSKPFKNYYKLKSDLKKFIKSNPDIESNIKSIPLKLKISILYLFKEFNILEKQLYITNDNFQKNSLDTLYSLINDPNKSDLINSIKLNKTKLEILDDIAEKANLINNFKYESKFFLKDKFYIEFDKMYEYLIKIHNILSKKIREMMPIAGQNKNRAIDNFIDSYDNIRKKTKENKDIYKHLITEFIWTINQDITISLKKMEELIDKINSNEKIKLYQDLLKNINFESETNPNLEPIYLKYNLDSTEIDLDEILKNIEEEIAKIEEQIRKLGIEKRIIEENIRDYGQKIDWKTIFELKPQIITQKIDLFKNMLSTVNNKLKVVYDLKYSNPNYKSTFDITKINSIANINEKTWLSNIVQLGGYNPIGNISNINKFHNLNNSVKKYMKTLEEIRNLTTELLMIYERFLENVNSTIIYLLYKINVLTLIKNNIFIIPNEKFNKDKLISLNNKLISNKKQNLLVIIKIFTNIIIKIIEKLNIENKLYLDLNPEEKSILIIFILYHLEENLK